MTVEHKGFIAIQSRNGHITLKKGDRITVHIPTSKQLTENELKEKIEYFIEFKDVFFRKEGTP